MAPLFLLGISTEGTSYSHVAVERTLDEQGTRFGALFEPERPPGTIVIVTSMESDREELVTAKRYCVCNHYPDDHWEEEPPAHRGNDCRWNTLRVGSGSRFWTASVGEWANRLGINENGRTYSV